MIEADFQLQEIYKIFNPSPFLLKHSYLYRYLILSFDNYLVKRRGHKEGIDSMLASARDYLRQIKEICLRHQIQLICVIFPVLQRLSEYNEEDANGYRNIIGALRDFQVDFIDLHAYFPEGSRRRFRSDPNDHIHPSVEGHRIVADIIYDYLISQNYLR